jgi:hypothetical protein
MEQQHYHTHTTSVPLWQKVLYIGIGAGLAYWLANGGSQTISSYAGKAKDGIVRKVMESYLPQPPKEVPR